jgi:hypothetical protein
LLSQLTLDDVSSASSSASRFSLFTGEASSSPDPSLAAALASSFLIFFAICFSDGSSLPFFLSSLMAFLRNYEENKLATFDQMTESRNTW